MGKQTVLHPNWIIVSSKKEHIIDMHKNMDAPRGGDAKRKKPVSKGCILDDSVYVTIKITNNIIVEMENRVMD